MDQYARHSRRDEAERDFEAFVATSGSQLLAAAIVIAGGDARRGEELLQSALARAFARWGHIRGDDPVPYVRMILLNAQRDWWRRIGSREVLAPDPASDLAAQTDTSEDTATRQTIVQALATLPVRERTVLVLRFMFDLSEQQTAHELSWRLGTVKSTTSRALARLRTNEEFMQQFGGGVRRG